METIKENQLREKISNLTEEYIEEVNNAVQYRDFFYDALKELDKTLDKSVKTPKDLNEAEREGFFRYVNNAWREESDPSLNEMEETINECYIRVAIRSNIQKL